MFFYICLITVCFLSFTLADYPWPNKWQKKILITLPCVIITLMAIFRFDVGYDYPTYYMMATPSYQEEVERFEPLSYFLVQLAASWNMPYMTFILYGIPTYCIVWWVCRKIGNFQLAFWTYIFLFLFSSFGAIRQALAMAIILLAILAMLKRRMLLFILLCIIASLFHTSALIMLPMYFVYYYISWKAVLIGMIGMVIFFPIVISFLMDNELYLNYFRSSVDYEGGSLVRFFYIGLYFLLLFLAYKNRVLKESKGLFTILLPSMFFPFLFGGHLGGRLSWYLYLVFIFLIPQILSVCGKKVRMCFMLMLCSYFFAFLYVSQRAGDKSPYTPYKTIFEVDLAHPHFK